MLRIALLLAAVAAFPPTRVATVKETLHGVTIADPYRWLEDQNSPETRAWIDAQIQYTRVYLAGIPRERLKSRLTELRRVDSVGTPTMRGNRYFFTRRLKQENRTSICMRAGFGGKDEVIVNPNDVSPDESVSVLLGGVSEDGSILAYGVRKGGEDEVEIRLLDLKTRNLLADALPRARYSSFSLKKDNSGFYYGRLDPEGPRIYYHALGAKPGEDRKIFGDGYTPSNWISARLSDEDNRWLLVNVGFGAAGKTEIFLRDERAQGPVRPVPLSVSSNHHDNRCCSIRTTRTM